MDREGKPFFWLGDTAWPLFTRYSQTQAEDYLRTRAAMGFTVIQAYLMYSLSTDLPPGEHLPAVPCTQGRSPAKKKTSPFPLLCRARLANPFIDGP
jgi:hypothetical protein